MRRIRLILYEGDETNFRYQFGTPDAPRGLQDGVSHGLATRITIQTIDDPRAIEQLMELFNWDLFEVQETMRQAKAKDGASND